MAARKGKPTELATFAPPLGGSAAPAGSPVFINAEPEPSAVEERRARELDEILESLGSDGQVIVYHVINGKTTYAGNMTMDGFSLGSLMDNYGGGDKTLVFMQGNKRVDTIRVPLDPSVPVTSPRVKEMERQTHNPSAPAAAPSAAFDLPAMLTAQAANFAAMMSATNQQSALMMNTLIGILTAQNANKTDPTETFVRLMAVMKENTTPATGALGPDQIMGLIEKGMSIGSRMNGEQDDVMGMVGKGLDTLGTIVSAMVNKKANPELPPGAPVMMVPPPVAIHDGPAPVAITHEENGMPRKPAPPIIRPWVDTLRPFVPMVVGVVNKMAPDAAAELLTNQLDDEGIDDMIADIKAPDFAARLGTYFPAEIEQITETPGGAEWLGAVLHAVLEYDHDEDEDGAAPEPGTPSA